MTLEKKNGGNNPSCTYSTPRTSLNVTWWQFVDWYGSTGTL